MVSAAGGGVQRRERGARALTWLYATSAGLALLLWLSTRWGPHRANWLELLFGVANIPLSHSWQNPDTAASCVRVMSPGAEKRTR